MDPKKSPFKSKTIWVSLFVAIAAFFPAVQAQIVANPEGFGLLVGGLFALLRLVSKGKISVE